jgi:xylulokinase
VGKDTLLKETCNPPLTGFQAPKILWLRNHEPGNFEKLKHVLLPKDYVRYRISGALCTDPSDASGTGLLDVPHRRWSLPVIQALDLDPALLPSLVESWEQCGTDASGAPVAGGAGDQAAAAVGTGAVRPGVISVSLGTSGVVFTALDQPETDPAGAAHTFCHATGKWHSMGVMLSCGGALRWYRDTFCSGMTYDEIAAEAAEIPVGSEGVTFLPFLAGERCPINDPYASGAFAGLRLGHRRAHLSRAVFEAVSFGLGDCLDLLTRLGAKVHEIRVTGGGAGSAFWVQLLADVFGAPCKTLVTDEGPAFGAALLAGVAAGVWPDVQSACDAAVRVKSVVEPTSTSYSHPRERYRDLYLRTKCWSGTKTKQ